MSQDEFTVVIELDPIQVTVDEVLPVGVIVDDTSGLKVVLAGNMGPPGEQGDTGPQGPPGQDADSQFQYVHNQGLPASTWNITHNLNGFPNVTVVDSAGTRVEGNVEYIDNNNITINFSAIFSGKAYLS